MMSIQDKELKSLAFELYKQGDLTVDEAYKKALDFQEVKKDFRGLDVIDRVSCSIKPTHNGLIVTFYKRFESDDFEGLPRKRFVMYEPLGGDYMELRGESSTKDSITKYTLDEVSKVLIKDGKVCESVDLYCYYENRGTL